MQNKIQLGEMKGRERGMESMIVQPFWQIKGRGRLWIVTTTSKNSNGELIKVLDLDVTLAQKQLLGEVLSIHLQSRTQNEGIGARDLSIL